MEESYYNVYHGITGIYGLESEGMRRNSKRQTGQWIVMFSGGRAVGVGELRVNWQMGNVDHRGCSQWRIVGKL